VPRYLASHNRAATAELQRRLAIKGDCVCDTQRTCRRFFSELCGFESRSRIIAAGKLLR